MSEYGMCSGSYNTGKLLLEIMGIEMWKGSLIYWMRIARSCLRIVIYWDMCRTQVAPCVQSVFEHGGAKSQCLTERAVFMDYLFVPYVFLDRRNGQDRIIRGQNAAHGLPVVSFYFIQAFSVLSSLKPKLNLPYRRQFASVEFDFALYKVYRSWAAFFLSSFSAVFCVINPRQH